MKNSKNKVSVNSLCIGFGSGKKRNALLPPLSATAQKGELISVIGKNGIGKSTLLRSLAGIQNNLGGDIFYNGSGISEYTGNELARIAGFISTEPVKVSNMTVFDLVSLGRFPYTNWLGTLNNKDLAIIRDAMDKASVLAFSSKYVAELSDGERQRAMIARLLSQDAEVLLMDEPTAFLDIRSKFEIIHLLHELSHYQGKTIILTTHDLDLAIRHSDKIWLMLDTGIREGAPEDLMINRMFDHLFDSGVVKFNSEEGTYSFNDTSKGFIYIEGEMVIRKWTVKAIERAGFTVSREKIADSVLITSDRRWILTFRGMTKEFYSIYDLTRDLLCLT